MRHWCDEVMADVGRHGVAATVYDDMFASEERAGFAGLASDEKRRSVALALLANFVRTFSPETHSRG